MRIEKLCRPIPSNATHGIVNEMQHRRVMVPSTAVAPLVCGSSDAMHRRLQSLTFLTALPLGKHWELWLQPPCSFSSRSFLTRDVALIVRLSRLGLCVLVYLRVYSPSSGFRFGLSRTSGLISGEVVPRSLVFLGAQHPSTSVQLFLLYIISPKTRASKCYRGDWYDVQQPSLHVLSLLFYLTSITSFILRIKLLHSWEWS